MPARQLDETDRQIIHCLQGDARNVTTAEIGRRIDVSGSTVANRISLLEDDGIIRGYTPVIDYERSGYRQHHLLVGTITGGDREAVLDAIPKQSGVINVTSLLADERNVVVEVIGREPEEIETVVESVSDLGVTVLRTDLVTSEVARAFDGFGERRNSDT